MEPVGPRHRAASSTGLWWLRLDAEGNAVEEAGPLLGPGAIPDGTDVRSPSLVRSADGRLALAYLSGTDGPLWDLRVMPLALDADGRPRPSADPGPRLAENCLAVAPAVSADGRWISVVRHPDGRGRSAILRLEAPAPARDGSTLAATEADPTG